MSASKLKLSLLRGVKFIECVLKTHKMFRNSILLG